MDEEIQQPTPEDFREEIEESVQRDEQALSESPSETPDSLEDMQEMGSAAAAEEQLDVTPPPLPAETAEEPPPTEPAPESPPPALSDLAEMGQDAVAEAGLDQPQVAPPALDDMESMAEDATAEAGLEQPLAPPPAVSELEGMSEAAEIPKIPGQQEQIRATEMPRELEMFQQDAGEAETVDSGASFVQTESARWASLISTLHILSQFAIDNRRELEQLKAMLERER